MTTTTLEGRTALVTGASSGLGVDFARELASQGARLILVARREAQLQALARELHDAHGVAAEAIAVDLAQPAAREQLVQRLTAGGARIDVLVNNAGFGLYGEFAAIEWPRTSQMLELDVVALTHLTRLLLPGMIAGGYGRILQVASTAAFQPTPGYAAYAAAKAYVLSFGVALNHELRSSGVTCTTVCPGVTETEFLKVSGQPKNWFHRATMMNSAKVAHLGVCAMLAGRPSIVTGWANALGAVGARLTPIKWAAAVSAWAMRG